jgi:pyroglutamyl-peptidase
VSFSEDTVIVTGFGPFGEHKINAIWETVKLLQSLNIEEEFCVKLII